MLRVRVLINLPAISLDHSYTYMVPQPLREDIEVGKRVLVELGNRKVEAFVSEILGEEESSVNDVTTIKPVLKVLDREAIFDHNLFLLAEWMAESYLCPISLVLKLMTPRLLRKKKGVIVTPALKREEIELWSSRLMAQRESDFLDLLLKRGNLSLYEAKKYLSNEEIKALVDENVIKLSGHYSAQRVEKIGYVYVLKDFDLEQDLPLLEKAAPRQAEAVRIIAKEQEVDCILLEQLIPARSIKSLLEKSFIERQKKKSILSDRILQLNREQETAYRSIKKALINDSGEEFLLFGVTGSGKTEIYIRSVEKAIQQGRTAIVLVPEIALTRHLLADFSSRIKNMAVMHSAMADGERHAEWKRIRQGEVDLVLGTRSAIFAPLHRLGLIIIDEEQESSYKQEDTPKYRVHEVARKRAELDRAVLLMGSATPSLDTLYRAVKGEMKLLSLKQRVAEARMPIIRVENMKAAALSRQSRVISPFLSEKLATTLQRGEQSILFINRRGYSPLSLCRSCGNILLCPSCSVGLTYHQDTAKNLCHYCNYQASPPVNCPFCGSRHMSYLGLGTQRVEEESQKLFPTARIQRLDMDSSRRVGFQESILERMEKREIDILIGTQMVAKGLNFPHVSLVGIVDADSMLNLPDFRAAERCIQLLLQVAGRSGRGSLPGEVIIQTFNPANPLFSILQNQDYLAFFYQEIKQRRLLNYPPFTQLLRIVCSAESPEMAQMVADVLSREINDIIDAKEEDIEILGPAPCPLLKIRNRYRWQLTLKCENMLLLKSIARYIIDYKDFKNTQVEWDLNPVMTM
ncbi:MAG: primosomal protein N' [Syntrophomonas sp.]|uniref:replication restart helicase PriA n=1 Tax=Syntrophomonas sp. TaxID=2053627 RepID=UPI002630928A|nr:primosomal protein N' [Syntrophomonas sp.]MDD2509725.1 primosomal protein N' [Syntrophomonas sp.]MDD4625857.1 primosomal protein N' [Syntrophomonas sp.]